ncbi:MAG: DUF1080 domain-containing protein, partial [Planctomycetes bacterium]|nr:DUF1080 domain-containing protein [Planctomycetota bacterium]
ADANKMLKGPAVRDGWDAYDRKKPVASKKSCIKSPNQLSWTNLAEDKALSQWENPYDYGKAEVVDGEVHLTSEKGKWFLLTKKEYANFVFEGDIKMPVNEGNSGFLFRCQKRKNKAWGYQAEVDTADRKWSGGLYDEGRRKWFISPNRDQAASSAEGEASIAAFRARAGECFKQDEWNTYRIVCIGSHIQIYVNGVLTTDVHDEMDISGYIGIQHHGEKGLLYKFRNLRIKDLGTGGKVCYPHREEAAKKASASKAVASTLKGDVYEAEAAVLKGANAASNHGGFQGKGFADYGDAGSSVLWDNVLGEKGQYVLTFRYASSGNRPCELFVNNQKAGRLAFASTGSFTKWGTVQAKVTLKEGGNAVKVVSLGAGPNLDALGVTKP